jgi:hypothetical protein
LEERKYGEVPQTQLPPLQNWLLMLRQSALGPHGIDAATFGSTVIGSLN